MIHAKATQNEKRKIRNKMRGYPYDFIRYDFQNTSAFIVSEMSGYGMCGHKNEYSTGVRCGSWVEDLVSNEVGNSKMSKWSEASDRFKDPGRPERTQKSSLSSGLTYPVLLAHCQKGDIHFINSDRSMYQTTHKTSFVESKTESLKNTIQRRKDLERDHYQDTYASSYAVESCKPFSPQSCAKTGGKQISGRVVSSMGFTKSFQQAQQFQKLITSKPEIS